MEAWIATDVDGESFLYFYSQPKWIEEDGWWEGVSAVLCPHQLDHLCPREGYCQPIALEPAPAGEAKRGEDVK